MNICHPELITVIIHKYGGLLKIAIIPARGGSKRIPRKNIKNFLGKPLIGYAIEACLAANIFDHVIVSTDDDEIAQIAIKFGATVPFKRSSENSNDFATTSDVLFEVISNLKIPFSSEDYFCCIYPTAAFITADLLENSFKLIHDSGASGVISIAQYPHPPQRAFQLRDKMVDYINPQFASTRTQDLEKLYFDAGQFYWSNVLNFINTKKLINSDTLGFTLKESEVQDIDNEEDWKIAEIKYKYQNGIS